MDKEKLEQISREKLKEELEQIESKIRLKSTEITNSQEYQTLSTLNKDLGDKQTEMKIELKKLKQPIYLKYVNSLYGWGMYRFRTKDIKSFVKQGIKKGLGITSVAFIPESYLMDIVEQLINKDLEEYKIEIDKLENRTKEIEKKFSEIYSDKDKIIEKGLSKLKKQRKKIYNELNEKQKLKSKRIERKQKEVSKQIDNYLPKFMGKITKEVNKRLMLESLE